jgi:hypothetical protein
VESYVSYERVGLGARLGSIMFSVTLKLILARSKKCYIFLARLRLSGLVPLLALSSVAFPCTRVTIFWAENHIRNGLCAHPLSPSLHFVLRFVRQCLFFGRKVASKFVRRCFLDCG